MNARGDVEAAPFAGRTRATLLALGGRPTQIRLRPTALGGWLAALVAGSLVLALLVPPVFGLVSALACVVLLLAAWFAYRNVARTAVALESPRRFTAGIRTPLVLAVGRRGFGTSRDLTLFVEHEDSNPAMAAFVGQVDAARPVELDARLRWWTRGAQQELAIGVRSTFPAGLFESRAHFQLPVEHLVLPRVLRPNELPPELRALLGDGGSPSRPRAFGEELHGLEAWRPGESLARVHWKHSAKRGQRLVRRFDGAERPSMRLVFDPRMEGSGRRMSATFEYGVTLFASLAVHLLRADTRLEIHLGQGNAIQAQRGRADVGSVLSRLALVEPLAPRSDVDASSVSAKGAQRPPSAVVRIHFGHPTSIDSTGGPVDVEIDALSRRARKLLPRAAGSVPA